MAAIAGKGGKVMVGSDTVAFVENWTMGISNEALATHGLGATARTFIGLSLPEGTGTVQWRALDNSDTASAAIRAAALANATPITLKLYESATKYWDASEGAIITSLGQEVPVEGLVTGSFGFTLSGTIAYT